MMGNIPLFMVPLNHDEANRRKPPPFDSLFKNVAEDTECRALARRLFWGVSTELVPVATDGELAAESIPTEQQEKAKSGPSFVYIRLRADAYPAESTSNVIVARFSYRRLSRQILDEARPLTENSMADAFDDADDFGAVLLLCNDYLLRHDADWIVVGKRPHTKESLETTKFDLEDAKTDHARQLEDFFKKYAPPAK